MSLIKNKFLLFGGKGGVGKTSISAATALQAASRGKKVLVMSTDPAHSLSDSFGVEIGNKVTKIKENLSALEIDATILLQEYKKKYGNLIKQIADEGTFFGKDDIQQFFDLSLPGMDELMALLKIMEILSEGKYDLLILDTAPTGHTIRLLELPDLMTSYIKVLAEMRQKHRVVVKMMVGKYVLDEADKFINKMHDDVEQLKKVLQDKSTQFVPVLTPEKMVIAETERLVNVLEKYSIHVNEMIINRVIKNNCEFCKKQQENQQKYLQQIRKKFFKYKFKEVPLFPTEIKGKTLDNLSSVIFEDKSELSGLKSSKVVRLLKKLKIEKKENFSKLAVGKSTQFLLFGGKGGVGKTSCATAVALEESKRRKVLIFSTDPAHSLSDSFGISIGDTVKKINDNLFALEINSNKLLEDLKRQYKKEIHDFFSSVFKSTSMATIDAPYDRRVMEDLFDLCPPGIDEIMALKTIMDLMREEKYDLFILDTAPTGHTIRLLEMPEIAEEWVTTLLEIQDKYPLSFEIGETLQEMLDTIKQVRKMLADSAKSEFMVVAIPESMSVLETSDLVAGLKRLKVSVKFLIINKIIPVSKCGFCSVKRSEQMSYVKQLSKLGLKMIGVELFENEIQGKESLMKLGEKLF